MFIRFNGPQQNAGPLSKILAAAAGLLLLGVALMFSLVFFVVLAVAGLLFWLYFWWKTRALRRQMREQMSAQGQPSEVDFGSPVGPESGDGEIIEGEATRVIDEKSQLPR